MNNFLKFYVVLFLYLGSSIFPSFSQINISLKQAIDMALNDNIQVRQSLVSEAIADQNFKQAKFSLLPTLNANINESINFGRSLDYTTYSYVTQKTNLANESLVTNFTLFQGFQKINQISANKLLLDANKSATQKLKNDLTLNVILLFLNSLSSKGQLQAANQQLKIAQDQLEVALKSVSVGKKLLADVSVSRTQVAKAELDIATIQNQLTSSTLDLLQLMNLPAGSKLNFIEPEDLAFEIPKRSTFEIYNLSSHTLPETKQAVLDEQYAETQLKITKGGYYPTISLAAGVASNYSRILGVDSLFFGGVQNSFISQFKMNLSQYIGVTINIPILNNFSVKTNVNKAKLDLQAAKLNVESVQNTLYKVINQANEDLNTSEKTYLYSKEQYNAALETFDIIQKRYTIGLSNSIDLSQAQKTLNQAQFDLIHAKYDLIFKAKVIDFYLGKELSY